MFKERCSLADWIIVMVIAQYFTYKEWQFYVLIVLGMFVSSFLTAIFIYNKQTEDDNI